MNLLKIFLVLLAFCGPEDWSSWIQKAESQGEFQTKPMNPGHLERDKANHVVYYKADVSQSVRDTHKVRIKNGLLYDSRRELITTDESATEWLGNKFEHVYIYIMDKEGNFYIGRQVVNHFHHSSFFGGEPIAAAGQIRVRNGKLTYIDNQSGHYTPNQELLAQALVSLRRQGVDINGVEVGFRTSPRRIGTGVLHGFDPPPQPTSFLGRCFNTLSSIAGALTRAEKR